MIDTEKSMYKWAANAFLALLLSIGGFLLGTTSQASQYEILSNRVSSNERAIAVLIEINQRTERDISEIRRILEERHGK